MSDDFDWDNSPLFTGPDSGASLLDDVETFLTRFVVYPGEPERVAHVLWVAHAWLMDCWDSTPRIAFLSPEPGSGKSRALEVTEPLVPRPVHAVNCSSAYIFRKISDDAGPPTILFDEIDTIFGPKAKENEELRGVLNAGHRRGASAGRCVIHGKSVEIEELPAYCAVALAGLDDLPDTLAARSVIVRMRRRAPGETVEPWRQRINGPEGEKLGQRLSAWADVVHDRAADTWPDIPAEITDRNADIWEALLSVADLAGGDWPDRARRNSVTLVTRPKDDAGSLGVMLLRDLRGIFTTASVDKMSTDDVLKKLVNLDESPWGDLRGKELDARGLSRRLARYGVKPRAHRLGDIVFKGYSCDDLADPWSRYLSPAVTDGGGKGEKEKDQLLSGSTLPLAHTAVTSVTESQFGGAGNRVTDVTDVRPDGREGVSSETGGFYSKPGVPGTICELCGDMFPTNGHPVCDSCDAEVRSAT